MRGLEGEGWSDGIVKMSFRGTQRPTLKKATDKHTYSVGRHHVLW